MEANKASSSNQAPSGKDAMAVANQPKSALELLEEDDEFEVSCFSVQDSYLIAFNTKFLFDFAFIIVGIRGNYVGGSSRSCRGHSALAG
ncbi:hypothetical protein EON65_48465 [archaeon]|nr:MAG: hypothetical protein EON65_48465 [archaeon]